MCKASRLRFILTIFAAIGIAGCGGGGGGGGDTPQPNPIIAGASDFWVSTTGSAWTLDGVDLTPGTPVRYRDRVSIGDPIVVAGQLAVPFNASRPLNEAAAPQYRSYDGTDGIRAWLEAAPTTLNLSYIELPNQIRVGSYKAFEATEAVSGGTMTLRIDVNVVGFEPISLPGVSTASALKTVHTFTATISASGQTASASTTLTLWYVKGLGVVKQVFVDPSIAAPNNTITEELVGAITPTIRTGVVGDFDLLPAMAPVSSSLNFGRPGVASDGSGYLIAARSIDASLYAHVHAIYVDGTGRAVWTKRLIEDLGLAATSDEYGPVPVIWDGSSFWVVALNDRPLASAGGLVRQRVTPAGALLDGPSGAPLANGVWPALATDGSNVLAVYGRNLGGPSFDWALYATLFARDGTVLAAEQQIALLGSGSNGFASAAFNAGRYLVAYERDALTFPYDRDLMFRRLDAAATLLDSGPIALSTAVMSQGNVALAPWGADFAAVWVDGRNIATMSQPERAIYGGRIRGSDAHLIDGVDSATAGVALDPTPTSRFGTAAVANAQTGLLLWSAGAYPVAGAPEPGIHGHYLAVGGPLDTTTGVTPDRHIGSLSSPQALGRLMAPAAATNGTGFLAVWAEVESQMAVRGSLVFPRYEAP